MEDTTRAKLDELLAMLADEVLQRAQRKITPPVSEPEPDAAPGLGPVGPVDPAASVHASDNTADVRTVAMETGSKTEPVVPPAEGTVDPIQDSSDIADPEPEPAPASGEPAAPILLRLTFALVVLLVLINLPLGTEGRALARSIPSVSSLVIMDGSLVKESDKPEVWVYRGGRFHWISSLEEFKRRGYRWEQVQSVDPGFLDKYPKGAGGLPVRKCEGNPQIYGIQDGRKRWIVDIASFTAEGYVWGNVVTVPCAELQAMPDGESIPPGKQAPPLSLR